MAAAAARVWGCPAWSSQLPVHTPLPEALWAHRASLDLCKVSLRRRHRDPAIPKPHLRRDLTFTAEIEEHLQKE